MRIAFFVLFNSLLWLVCLSSKAQPSHVFHQLSVKDGLSEGTVRAIVEDKRGFMWFGTEDGLNKYDGYKFTVFKSNTKDKYSISSNNIKCFLNDSKGNLWVGTRTGLSIYDHLLDRFYNFNNDKYLALKFIEGDIEHIYEDKKGCFWVLTSTHGLYKINALDQEPERFMSATSHPSQWYVSMAVDHNGDFWIGTYKGLVKFDTQQKKFEDYKSVYGSGYQIRAIYINATEKPTEYLWLATTEGLKRIHLPSRSLKGYKHENHGSKSIGGNNSIRILPDDDKLLIAIDGKGVDVFDPVKEVFYHYTKETGAQLSSNNITAIYKDSKGTLWLGTFLNGINFSNTTTNFFVMVRNNSPSEESVKNGVVTHFLKEPNGNFWISTDGGGLYLKQQGKSSFANFTMDSHPNMLRSNAVTNLLKDKDQNLWLVTYAGGLTRISPSGQTKIFHHDPNDHQSLVWEKIKAAVEYKDQIWVSSYGMGICVFDKKTEKFKQYRHDPANKHSIPSNWVYWFLVDSRGTLWLASFDGLCRYDGERGEFTTFRFSTGDNIFDKNYIFDIFEDSHHQFWLGSNGGGLILFDRDKGTFKDFTTAHGLSDNAVKSIIEDQMQQLWLATNNGITKFVLNTQKATAYTLNDGLPPGSFFYNAKYRDEQGKIYFGTNEGYLVVDPSLSEDIQSFPKVALTELSVFNVPLSPKAANSPLDKHISQAKQVTLPYDQNSVSFEYAALNFSIPRQNYYAYMLEGFDHDWNYTGKNRIAKYTNLDPGTYVFKVKASNHKKLWGAEMHSFTLTITPPFWQTWWFRGFLLLLLGFSLVAFVYLRTRSITQRNKWLSDQVSQRTRELQDINQALSEQTTTVLEQRKELLDKKYSLEKNNEKLSGYNEFMQKLIGIIGHDIRGPIQRFSALLKVVDEESKDFVMERLRENAAALSILSTDLLSWVSLQSSKEALEMNHFTWKEVWDKALMELEAFRSEKQISISVKHQQVGTLVRGVQPIALASVRNILSNALKFSEVGSMLEIETGIVKKNHSAIRITDFGKGFVDVVQVNQMISGEGLKGLRAASMHESAGLGMSICYDMIKRCDGWIEAASLPGSGASFYVYLPLSEGITVSQEVPVVEPAQPQRLDASHVKLLKDKVVLMVDDDDELRWGMIKALSAYVSMHEARSGEEALVWLKDHSPDFVLLDIKMSGMSGIELCKKLKQSPESAHIPCMVISGEMNDTIRKDVLNAGADSFLPKPVTADELLLQMVAYFENREKQLKRFFKENIAVDEINMQGVSKEFLQKLVQLVEANLDSPDLGVEFLAREMGTSKSTLYRNLKSLTGQSANAFIMNIRLRKSLILLKEGKLNISEVSAEMGFNSPSYFTTVFKKHFGFSPNELK